MNVRGKLVAAASWLLLTTSAHAASFDCGKASNAVERTICADTEISALDDEMAVAYRKSLAANPEVRGEQIEWIKRTRQCASEAATIAQCLKREYTSRLNALKQPAQPEQIVLPAAAPPVAPVPSNLTSVVPDQQQYLSPDIRMAEAAQAARQLALEKQYEEDERNRLVEREEKKRAQAASADLERANSAVKKGFETMTAVSFGFVILFALISFLAIPFALVWKRTQGVVILENLTDSIFTVGSLTVGLFVSLSIGGVLNYPFRDAVQSFLFAICLILHFMWTYRVSKRSNITSSHVLAVALSRTFLSCLPLVYLMLGHQTIQGKKSTESVEEYQIRREKETERNERRQRDRILVSMVLIALTAFGTEKFRFESLTSYFRRNTAFV